MFIIAIKRKSSYKTTILLIVPILISLFYIYFKIYLIPKIGIVDININNLNTAVPIQLLDRFTNISVLLWAWILPMNNLIQRSGLYIPNRWSISSIIIVAIFACMLIVRQLINSSRNFWRTTHSNLNKRHYFQLLTAVSLVAGGFVLAGYIPIIAAFEPNLDDVSTRVNMYSIPAASLVLVVVVSLTVIIFSKDKKQWQILITAGTFPLLILGMGIHLMANHSGQVSWITQKSIWQQLFEIAPMIKENTTVVFVMNGYYRLDYGAHPPLYAEWEATSALRILYEDESLASRIYFPNTTVYSEATFTPNGIEDAFKTNTTSYDHVILFKYQPGTELLKLILNPEDELGLGFRVANYAPLDRIISDTDKFWKYRYLVQDNP